MTEVEVTGLFTLAGFNVLNKWELTNQYWGRNDRTGPWWLVKTEFGLIRVGWRKNVIDIDWSDTEYEGFVTEDQVTKSGYHVHTWNTVKALEYLQGLRGIIGS